MRNAPSSTRCRRRLGYTLVETMVALGVFALGSLGIWECISVTFFLTAKNTGLNLSHASLQYAVDTLAERLRASMQLIDVATFDGTAFTPCRRVRRRRSQRGGQRRALSARAAGFPVHPARRRRALHRDQPAESLQPDLPRLPDGVQQQGQGHLHPARAGRRHRTSRWTSSTRGFFPGSRTCRKPSWPGTTRA